MVARGDDERGIGIFLFQLERNVGDARSRILAAGLGYNVLLQYIGQLLGYEFRVLGGSNHVNIFGGNEAGKALKRPLDESFAGV